MCENAQLVRSGARAHYGRTKQKYQAAHLSRKYHVDEPLAEVALVEHAQILVNGRPKMFNRLSAQCAAQHSQKVWRCHQHQIIERLPAIGIFKIVTE